MKVLVKLLPAAGLLFSLAYFAPDIAWVVLDQFEPRETILVPKTLPLPQPKPLEEWVEIEKVVGTFPPPQIAE